MRIERVSEKESFGTWTFLKEVAAHCATVDNTKEICNLSNAMAYIIVKHHSCIPPTYYISNEKLGMYVILKNVG